MNVCEGRQLIFAVSCVSNSALALKAKTKLRLNDLVRKSTVRTMIQASETEKLPIKRKKSGVKIVMSKIGIFSVNYMKADDGLLATTQQT